MKQAAQLSLAAAFLAASILAADTLQAQEPKPAEAKPQSAEPTAQPAAATAPKEPKEPKPRGKAVDPKSLIKFIPETIIPWEGRTPVTRTEDLPEGPVTVASRLWTKEDPDLLPTAEVRISDYANAPEALKKMIAEWKSTKVAQFDEIKRYVDHQGMHSFQEFNTSDNFHSWSFSVGERYLVLVEVTDVIPSEMDPWVKVLNFKGLAAHK